MIFYTVCVLLSCCRWGEAKCLCSTRLGVLMLILSYEQRGRKGTPRTSSAWSVSLDVGASENSVLGFERLAAD